MKRRVDRLSRRRCVRGGLALAGIGLLAGCGSLPLPGQQPPKVPLIGLLSINVDAQRAAYVEAFHQGLRELGYVEGRNLTIETRAAQGDQTRLPALSSELVGLGVALIVAGSSIETEAALGVTRTIPIVMLNSADPVAQGFVASLDRPGGNVTGLTAISRVLVSKRLELLKETVPGLARAAMPISSRPPRP
jgi:putative ABC transport system substrate-binding protein